MSAIKKMNQDLRRILGRDSTIHEQIDMLILSVLKERAIEYQLAYQMNPTEDYKEQYQHTIKCINEVQDRNPEIFTSNDSEGGDDDYI
tara:strand:- start:620 stop:883 length:264 start_codon:yes stop_codon:yes gene_type:complete